jgi:hypothetical protein
MLRKHIVKAPPSHSVPEPGEMDIAATATVQVTSEDPAHPIEHVFDPRRGPGGSRWVAAEPGKQTLILAFDTPQTIHPTIVEVEELEVRGYPETRLGKKVDLFDSERISHDTGVRSHVKKRPVSKVLSLGSDGRAMDHCGTVAPTCQAAPARRAPARSGYAGSPQYVVLPEPEWLPMGYVAARCAAQEYGL